jgi:hypothetical protein
MVTLQTVEIPGLRDAIKRESRIRDTAFLDGLELVCGVEVAPLTLRRLIWLEQAHNGLVCPWKFESMDELLAHSVSLLYFCTPNFNIPTSPKFSFWKTVWDGAAQYRFRQKILGWWKPDLIVSEVGGWVSDSMMDAPQGGGNSEVKAPSFASYPAYIVDKFAQAGLPFTYEEIMTMPLRRLWQHWRICVRRVDEATITNPSDELAVNYLEAQAK